MNRPRSAVPVASVLILGGLSWLLSAWTNHQLLPGLLGADTDILHAVAIGMWAVAFYLGFMQLMLAAAVLRGRSQGGARKLVGVLLVLSMIALNPLGIGLYLLAWLLLRRDDPRARVTLLGTPDGSGDRPAA